jgi:hypothetical protein
MVTPHSKGGEFARELEKFRARVTVLQSIDTRQAKAIARSAGIDAIALDARLALSCPGGTYALRRFITSIRNATRGRAPVVLYCPRRLGKEKENRLLLIKPAVDMTIPWPARPSDLNHHLWQLEAHF